MMPISPKTKKPVDFRSLLHRGAVLLDVRTKEEYSGRHLPDAVNIPYEDIGQNIGTIKAWDKPVLVYGAHDQRSLLAMRKLHNHGIRAYNAGSRDCLRDLLEQPADQGLTSIRD
jgi:phage shock protein E